MKIGLFWVMNVAYIDKKKLIYDYHYLFALLNYP